MSASPARCLAALGTLCLAAALWGATPLAGSPGSLDPTFGDGGSRLVTEGLPRFAEGEALESLRVLDDGRIVVLGTRRCGMPCRERTIARFGRAGHAEPYPLGPGVFRGVLRMPVRHDHGPQLEGLLLRTSGGVIAGYTDRGDPADRGDGAVARPPSPPSLWVVDRAGRRTTEAVLPFAFAPWSRLPGGVLVGLAGRQVVRLDAGLAPDGGFGVGGASPVPAAVAVVHAVVATRSSVRIGGSDDRGLVLARLDGRGRPAGVGRLPVPGWGADPADPEMVEMAVRRDGGTFLVARVPRRSRSGLLDVRTVVGAFRPDGRPDRRFGARGLVWLPEGDARIAVQDDGRVVTAGTTGLRPPVARPPRLVLRRLTPRGGADPAMPVRRLFWPRLTIRHVDVALDRRGRILVAADAIRDPGIPATLLVRFRGSPPLRPPAQDHVAGAPSAG